KRTAKGRDGRSTYHSPLRAKQAAETREAIVNAAIALFGERGWAATTLPMVAAEAGTAVDTIYSAFGSKSGLLMAAIDVAIAGDDDPTPMVDRPELARFAEGTTVERLRTGVLFTVGVYQRSLPILEALREAAASDEAARVRLAKYDDDRRNVMVAGLALILGRPAPEPFVDAIWALVSPEVYTMLTAKRGWSAERTVDWLVAMANAAVGLTEG
ncbi:MAG: TetR/AcrR family transcriptional regulator, partial [Actinobacteria bacterium]|nr:TetR/AcrR family transcriptional regulator [Actinomycetota bacterium]